MDVLMSVPAPPFLPGGGGVGPHVAHGLTFHLPAERSGRSRSDAATGSRVSFVHPQPLFLDFFKVPEARF
jgi:hypothetical protein